MIRIISGTLRGRTLAVPKGRRTRPTAARVREALFDVLEHHPTHGVTLEGARVLDLFSGTGALGIEALSRGAGSALFVENANPAARALRQNLERLGIAHRARVLRQDVSTVLQALSTPEARRGTDVSANAGAAAIPGQGWAGPFTLVLADPPYADQRAFELFRKSWHPAAHLAPDGVLMLERAAGSAVPPDLPGMEAPLVRRWGDTEVSIYRHAL